MENSVTIKLQYPVTYKTVQGETMTVSDVTLRRIRGKDLKVFPDSMYEGGDKAKNPAIYLPLIASMSNLPIAAVDEMDMDDILALIGAATPFLSKSPATGVS